MKLNTISTPTQAELREEFRFISRSKYQGVPGVFVFDSGCKGPTVGVTIHTHGNEPSGLAALWYLRNKFRLWEKLLCGRVVFVLNNLKATSRYFRAKSQKEKEATRFCDLNMNRLPPDMCARKMSKQYEIKRALDLLPVWQCFDAALDIHSEANVRSEPMIIEVKSDRRIARLIRKFPIGLRLSDVERFQLQKPMLAFCGNPKKRIPAVGIETGSHEELSSFCVASQCVLLFIAGNGLLNYGGELPAVERISYRFNGRILFPDSSWKLVKIFKRFEQVKRGQLLARNLEGCELRSPVSASVIFPPIGLVKANIADEVMFLAKKEP